MGATATAVKKTTTAGTRRAKSAPAQAAPESKGAVYVTKAELDHGLIRVGRAIARHAAIDAYRAVRLLAGDERVTLEVRGFDTHVEVELDAAFDGYVDRLVPHAELRAAIKGFNKGETITLRPLKDAIEARSGQARFKVGEVRREDWPEPWHIGAGGVVLVGTERGGALADAVAAALTHASEDDTRPVLTGVLLDATDTQPVLVGCDSYRLAVLDATDLIRAHKTAINLPARALRWATDKLDDEDVVVITAHGVNFSSVSGGTAPAGTSQSSGHAVVERDGERWLMRLIDGQYPNWRQLMPSGGGFVARIVIDRDRLWEAVDAAARVARKNQPLRILIQKTQVKLSIANPDGEGFLFEDTLSALVTGANGHGQPNLEAPEFGINPEFYRDAVAILDAQDDLTIDYISPMRPILSSAGSDQVLSMPIRLNV